MDATKYISEKRPLPKHVSGRSSAKSQGKSQLYRSSTDKRSTGSSSGGSKRASPENISWNVLDLKKENYFSCAVGRTRTIARYLLNSSDDVVTFLKEMATALVSNSSY